MKLTIPKPCHENWENMTPDEKGKFCSVCSKTVRDFTSVSDEDILDAFSASPKDICGNFNESQLNRDLQYSYVNSLFARFAVGFVLTSGGISMVNAQQHCEPKTDTIKHRRMMGKVAPKPVKNDTIKEQVIILGGIQTEMVSNYKPLYVVDGKVVDEKKFRLIKPAFIDTIQVLKGEAATVLYGNKATNGVIVMTTKRKRNK